MTCLISPRAEFRRQPLVAADVAGRSVRAPAEAVAARAASANVSSASSPTGHLLMCLPSIVLPGPRVSLRRRAHGFNVARSEAAWPRRAEEASDLRLHEAHPVEHRVERRLRRGTRLLGTGREQPLQLALVVAQLLVARAHW